MRALWRWIVPCLLGLGTCATPPAPAPSVAETPVVAAVETSNEQPAPNAAAKADAAAPGSGPRSDPARFGCGKLECTSGEQTCCLASTDAVCIPSVPDGPRGTIGAFREQWQACDEAPFEHGYSLSGISRCDESVDCKAAEICCEQFLFSGATVNLCEPQPPSGETPCEFGERCVEGSPCRMPGTECRRGYCVKHVKQLKCSGSGTCSEGETCCGDPPRCRADNDCHERMPRITCTRPADCLAGQHCLHESYSGANCTGHVDFVTPSWLEERGLSLVCDNDSDCRRISCATGKPRCKPELPGTLRGCACP